MTNGADFSSKRPGLSMPYPVPPGSFNSWITTKAIPSAPPQSRQPRNFSPKRSDRKVLPFAPDCSDIYRGIRKSPGIVFWPDEDGLKKWWLGPELNRRHKDFQSSALPPELPSRSVKCFLTVPRFASLSWSDVRSHCHKLRMRRKSGNAIWKTLKHQCSVIRSFRPVERSRRDAGGPR
jgi:hypothetical protein